VACGGSHKNVDWPLSGPDDFAAESCPSVKCDDSGIGRRSAGWVWTGLFGGGAAPECVPICLGANTHWHGEECYKEFGQNDRVTRRSAGRQWCTVR